MRSTMGEPPTVTWRAAYITRVPSGPLSCPTKPPSTRSAAPPLGHAESGSNPIATPEDTSGRLGGAIDWKIGRGDYVFNSRGAM